MAKQVWPTSVPWDPIHPAHNFLHQLQAVKIKVGTLEFFQNNFKLHKNHEDGTNDST